MRLMIFDSTVLYSM